MRHEERDDLRPEETDLVGQLLDTGSRIEPDAVGARIAWLTAERLEPVAVALGGTSRVFRDPRDGRLWELTYPWPHWPHGGPPRLTALSPEDAARRVPRSAPGAVARDASE